jgi:hypothetical protein
MKVAECCGFPSMMDFLVNSESQKAIRTFGNEICINLSP